jgi:hypothetical protein
MLGDLNSIKGDSLMKGLIVEASIDMAFAKIIRSSAKRRCMIGGRFLAIIIPLRSPMDSC